MKIRFRQRKPGKIAVVFSGGGAKGVYSAGVSKALVECGIRPDIITGSSVGAINAAILAETFLQWPRSEVLAQWRNDELNRQIEFWEQMTMKINGHKLKAASSATLTPMVLELLGLTTVLGFTLLGLIPQMAVPWISIPAGLVSLGLAARLGHKWFIEPLSKPKPYHHQPKLFSHRPLLNFYLWLHGYRKAIFSNVNLEQILTQFIPPERHFSHYHQQGIDLKLTRTNIRTGYKEVSEYLEYERPKRIKGNPRVLPGILASGAFPGAFPPVKLSEIYGKENNQDFWRVMDLLGEIRGRFQELWGSDWEEKYNGLLEFIDLWDLRRQEDGEDVEELDEKMTRELLGDYLSYEGPTELNHTMVDYLLEVLADLWKYRFYPSAGREGKGEDEYFDGGVADNTPISLAMDGLKDLLATGAAEEDEEHLIMIVMLSRPRRSFLTVDRMNKLNALDLGFRGLSMMGLDNMVNDMQNANRINRLLKKIPCGEGKRVLANLLTIYPDDPLPWVLAFDRRLGFRPGENGRFIAMGCRNTLEALVEARDRGWLPAPVIEKLERVITNRKGVTVCRERDCLYQGRECNGQLRAISFEER